MTLDEYVNDRKEAVEEFRRHWLKRRRESGRDMASLWPLEMEPGTWDDQFRAFEE